MNVEQVRERKAASGAPTLRYLPALDGLRAISVVAVILFHLDLTWIRGGFLGVDVFFVISGYLITALLLNERRRTGGVNLGQFWARRARRLLPALYVMLAVVSVWWLLFIHDEVATIRGDVLAALTYSTNWYLIFGHKSYFDAAGRPSPLRHLWSLAVEEQFYLLWPLVVGLALGRITAERFRQIMLGAAACSAILMAVLFTPGRDTSRVFYGTDTRAAALLIGACLASLWPPWRLRSDVVGSRAPLLLDAIGALSLVSLAFMFCTLNDIDSFIYRGGFVLLDVAALGIIAVAVHPADTWCRRLVGSRPMAWVGRRSYVLYLWHWPVFMVTRPGIDIDLTGWPVIVLRLALTAALAEATHRYIEEPIRHGTLWAHIKSAVSSVGESAGALAGAGRRRVLGGLGVGAVVVLAVTVGMATAQHPAVGNQLGLNGRTSIRTSGITPVAAASASTTTVPGEVIPSDGSHIDAIGDSVMLGAADALQKRMPGIVVDARIDRKFDAATAVAHDLGAHSQLRDVVVVHLGTNAAMTDGDIDRLFDALKPNSRVFLVNAKSPHEWEPKVNRQLAAAIARHPNARLLDWEALGNAHPEWFFNDQTHLNEVGKKAYANFIASAVTK